LGGRRLLGCGQTEEKGGYFQVGMPKKKIWEFRESRKKGGNSGGKNREGVGEMEAKGNIRLNGSVAPEKVRQLSGPERSTGRGRQGATPFKKKNRVASQPPS